MLLSKSLPFFLLGGVLSYASSLAVYQDKTLYTSIPQSNFVGFNQALQGKCEGNTILLTPMSTCPPDERLCKKSEHIDTLKTNLLGIHANLSILEKLLLLPKPTEFDAKTAINDAKLIAQERAKLEVEEQKIQQTLNIEKENFQREAPNHMAVESKTSCTSEMELTIPHGITFATSYEANIVDDSVKVSQYLSVVNRSGVDIEVDSAMFYYKRANQLVYPIHFNPWVVRKYIPQKELVKKMYKRKLTSIHMDMSVNEEGGDMAPVMPASIASYEDAREYRVTNLNLPSTGLPIELKLLSWEVPLRCETRVYPYVNTRAFHVCSFMPKYQIDSHRWKVKEDGVLLNDKASGEYYHDNYQIYTKVDEDIQISRKPIVQKERETGIFGGTARKKDGFTLTLTNKSDKEKTLTLIERIPTSTTEEIQSKLLSVKSVKKVDYKVLKDGKVEMHIVLAKNESTTIEVLFEITYDKDLNVNY